MSDAHGEKHHLVAVHAAREAGALAMTYFGADYAKWEKSRDNPVTEADFAVDLLLRQRLQAFGSGYGWLSEESVDDNSRRTARRVWVVDPIDGTRAFIRGQPHFAVCIALLEDGRPISAVIFNPATDELFEASEGGPALLNGVRVQVSAKDKLQDARMLASKGVFQHERWTNPWPAMHVESRNSIAYQVALTASGHFDGCMNLWGAYDWDLAAADLILRSAGGHITDHTGAALRFNQDTLRHPSIVAANPALHGLLLERLQV
ncbi:MAG: 3'(2'),5'-bisphosphate nucleotidase CysQ [Alphaproteobacteria bacterium]|nr:3'(2'),5'-bisphosphate nucleotidase CysQ [Alphaproteobacteria bacterium]